LLLRWTCRDANEHGGARHIGHDHRAGAHRRLRCDPNALSYDGSGTDVAASADGCAAAQQGAGCHMRPRFDRGIVFNDRAGVHNATVPDASTGLDNATGQQLGPGAELGVWRHHSAGMAHRCELPSGRLEALLQRSPLRAVTGLTSAAQAVDQPYGRWIVTIEHVVAAEDRQAARASAPLLSVRIGVADDDMPGNQQRIGHNCSMSSCTYDDERSRHGSINSSVR
jgi:hypothetical protein